VLDTWQQVLIERRMVTALGKQWPTTMNAIRDNKNDAY